MTFLWPVPGYHAISSGYADSRSYGLHGAIDIPAPAVPTVAIDAGIVIFTGWAGSAGRSVYIELEGGYRTHYVHLSRIDMAVGQAVTAGDVIGLVGGSGHGVDGYYGSHLHLNLFAAEQPASGPSHWVAWVGMWALDPELYLGQEDDVNLQELTDALANAFREIEQLRQNATDTDNAIKETLSQQEQAIANAFTEIAQIREGAQAGDDAIRARLDALEARNIGAGVKRGDDVVLTGKLS